MDRHSATSAPSSCVSAYQIALILIFLLTLPLINPWVRGDGVGYYAYARSILIGHNLDFRPDWFHANASFQMDRVDANGRIESYQYTPTGHLDNHFSIGPAILWAPFLIVAHAGVVIGDRLGEHVAADGFSRPYVFAISFGTALYGLLSIMFSFALARRFVPERWAFLASIGIWFGSSLPVYMYFNPSWSHAQSAFTVALFIWYWLRTRGIRSTAQWALLGALAGLMIDVYYPNAFLLLFPMFESLVSYRSLIKHKLTSSAADLLLKNALFCAVLAAVFSPTLITKKIVYGSFSNTGYNYQWRLYSPWLLKVLFSADHGLFVWTPVVILSVIGLFLLRRHDRQFSWYAVLAFVMFLYFIGCYPDWDGRSSFGNRFFISFTPLFIIGLAACFDFLEQKLRPRRAVVTSASVTAALVLWNLGLMFQWGMHLIPPRGPISWREAAYNQVVVVPRRADSAVNAYLTRRSKLMQHIEQTDVNELKSQRGQSAE